MLKSVIVVGQCGKGVTDPAAASTVYRISLIADLKLFPPHANQFYFCVDDCVNGSCVIIFMNDRHFME